MSRAAEKFLRTNEKGQSGDWPLGVEVLPAVQRFSGSAVQKGMPAPMAEEAMVMQCLPLRVLLLVDRRLLAVAPDGMGEDGPEGQVHVTPCGVRSAGCEPWGRRQGQQAQSDHGPQSRFDGFLESCGQGGLAGASGRADKRTAAIADGHASDGAAVEGGAARQNDPDGLDLFARALRAMKSHGAVSNQLAARRTVRLLDTVDCGLP